MSGALPSGAPLSGVRVLEVGGIGPAPFAGMLLAELGADVVRVDRPGTRQVLPIDDTEDLLNRGKRSIALDLKAPQERDVVLDLAGRAAILVEGYRPGVAERLGIGPEACQARNEALVYGRMTGWGQEGPRASQVGHDINYIGLVGALHTIGPAGGPPAIPVNYVGDFGGGALYLVIGLLAALREAETTGQGRVVDAAIVDGAAHLLASVHLLANAGAWEDTRGANLLDGAAPFYRTYETADGGHMAVGAIEPRFYQALLDGLGLDFDPRAQNDRTAWPETASAIAARFRSAARTEWTARFAGVDACVTPVLSLGEAARDEHLVARATLRSDGETMCAAAAPRFIPPIPAREGVVAPRVGADRDAVLDDWLNAEPHAV